MDNRLADLDIDVGDIVLFEKFPALAGHGDAVLARERCGHDADPEDDGRAGHFGVADANDIHARPLHVFRRQEGEDLGSQAAVLDVDDRMVADWPELLGCGVCLRAGGRLPWCGAGASDQGRAGGQAIVVVFGLRLRWGGQGRRRGGALGWGGSSRGETRA